MVLNKYIRKELGLKMNELSFQVKKLEKKKKSQQKKELGVEISEKESKDIYLPYYIFVSDLINFCSRPI